MGLFAGISVLCLFESFYLVMRQVQSSRKVDNLVVSSAPRVAWRNEKHALYQFSKYFSEFLGVSDIHGAKFTVDRKQGKCGRIFWLILTISSFVICLNLISITNKQAEKSPVVTVIDSRVLSSKDVRNL